MRMLATGSSRGGRVQAGFTLVELLVVLVLLGLVSGLAIVSLPSEKPATAAPAQALAGVVGRLTDQSVAEGRPLGLTLSPEGWQVSTFNAGWRPSGGPDGAVRLPVGVSLAHDVDATFDYPAEDDAEVIFFDDPLPLGDAPPGATGAPEDEIVPEIRFDPTGEVTPFEAVFRADGLTQTVRVSAFGRVEVGDAVE